MDCLLKMFKQQKSFHNIFCRFLLLTNYKVLWEDYKMTANKNDDVYIKKKQVCFLGESFQENKQLFLKINAKAYYSKQRSFLHV